MNDSDDGFDYNAANPFVIRRRTPSTRRYLTGLSAGINMTHHRKDARRFATATDALRCLLQKAHHIHNVYQFDIVRLTERQVIEYNEEVV